MHPYQCRIYYEDTDSGGVVYYANYLKFAERARTEWLRDMGISQQQLAMDEGCLFVVKHIDVDYLKPAKLDDLLNIHTSLIAQKKASLLLKQTIYCEDIALIELKVQIVSVTKSMKVRPLPKTLLKHLS